MNSTTQSINGSEIEVTNSKDIETQEKDLPESTNQTSEEEINLDKPQNEMKIPDGMTLPEGHEIHEGQDISMCPFFNINEKAKKRR